MRLKGNCLTFALRKWRAEGGYIVIRKSRYGWWPHFLHMDAETRVLTHLVPVKPERRWFPPLTFEGIVEVE